MSGNPWYRTLISGVLEQQAGLSVGGAAERDEGPDGCLRDGCGRLTIPGTGLAGALVETAARLYPGLVAADDTQRLLGRAITAKEGGLPRGSPDEADARLRQSVWRCFHAHPLDEPSPEWRQGVGIRQATGATARQKKALYDFEFVPVGTRWRFFLEVDTFRGGLEAEALAALALHEWQLGRGWLGRAPARGTGWIRLLTDDSLRVLRLPRTEALLNVWPDNTRTLADQLQAVAAAGVEPIPWAELWQQSRALAESQGWRRGDWHYLCFPVELAPGLAADGYGYDVLQVGGHPAGDLLSRQVAPRPALSQNRTADLAAATDGQFRRPDAPFVTTRPAGAAEEQPYLPGGGLRGPLRHTASRLARIRQPVRDPNHKDDPLEEPLRGALEERRAAGAPLNDDEIRQLDCLDPIAGLFGTEELCGRILVRDARLHGAEYELARVEHHAQDEFTGGVYAGSKFDRNVLLHGPLRFEIAVEAPSRPELDALLQPLIPTLELARLGQVPIGGSKWRGAGWVPWQIGPLSLWRAGDEQPLAEDGVTQEHVAQRVATLLQQANQQTEVGGGKET